MEKIDSGFVKRSLAQELLEEMWGGDGSENGVRGRRRSVIVAAAAAVPSIHTDALAGSLEEGV